MDYFLVMIQLIRENTPSDDLMCLKISAGEAYVRGYDIEKTGTTIIDVDKPRDVGIRSDVGIGYEMGNILKLNNVTKGSAVQNGSVVKLFDNFNSTGTNHRKCKSIFIQFGRCTI